MDTWKTFNGIRYNETAIKESIDNGVEFLEEFDPWWYRKINVGTLDVSKCELCICGQVFVEKVLGGYDWASDTLKDRGSKTSDNGFCLDISHYKKIFYNDKEIDFKWEKEYEILANLWILKIKEKIDSE